MCKIKILDCTLRDGGYINDWNFGEEAIADITYNLSQSGADIIECGFLSDKPYDKDKSIYSSTDDVNRLLPKNSNAMFVAMIAIGEKEIYPEKLPNASESGISGIRLTFHSDEIDKALFYGKIIKDKGYKLFMQPVGSTFYRDDKLLELILKSNKLEPFAFYIVDTLGCMYPRDVQRQLYLADYNLKEGINIGFHSHNNLQMAFANAQNMIEYKTKRTLIIDCSINGMGRGAGNLCSELICDYLNKNNDKKYSVSPILELADKYISSFYLKNPWGYSVAYYLSAVSRCHPNYVAYLMSQQTVNGGKISDILELIPEQKRKRFDAELISEIYQSFKENEVDDTAQINLLRRMFENKKILSVAPGKTIKTQKNIIQKYVDDNKPLVISINFIPKDIKVDICFVTSTKRYEMLSKKRDGVQLVFTSNVSASDENALVVNYSTFTNTSVYASDSAGTMLLKLLVKCSVNSVALAGFDGFDTSNANYFDSKFDAFIEKFAMQKKNEEIINQLKKRSKEIDISFVTSSQYADVLKPEGEN